MKRVAGRLIGESIKPRIQAALDVKDNPAPPLKRPRGPAGSAVSLESIGRRLSYKGYPDYKVRVHGGKPIRDWTRTGQLMDNLKAKKSSRNKATIGWTRPDMERRASYNNRRWRQFGMSPRDRAHLLVILDQVARGKKSPVQAKAA
jgi:hypothetical protein